MLDKLEEMILDGSAEVAGIDQETGEFLYCFTPKIAELHPELFDNMSKFYHYSILLLWEKGFLDIDMESDDPYVKLNNKSTDPEEIKKLSTFEQRMLESVVAQINPLND